MSYSADVLRRAQQSLARKKEDRASLYNRRLAEAYEKVPRLRELDIQLRRSMTVAAQAVFMKGGDAAAAMEAVKQANLALQQERQALVDTNFAPGYLDETPICPTCGGSGYIGSTMCRCLRQLCCQEQLTQLRELTRGGEVFENFRLDYYPTQVDSTYGASPRKIMEKNFAVCRRYAEGFAPEAGNLLFVGGTGLGKTFLSACIANELAQKGFSIAYESAPRLFDKLSRHQFTPDDQTRDQVAGYTGCDLLIIDDLGTELTNQFTIAALYSLLNDRLLENKPMIVSTNLNVEEIARRYSPQIASRLQGSFNRLTFVGQDIRVMKNRGL